MKTLIGILCKSRKPGTRSWVSFGNSDLLPSRPRHNNSPRHAGFHAGPGWGPAFFVPDSNQKSGVVSSYRPGATITFEDPCGFSPMIPYFTPRERRIAKLMALGIENREIARRVENSWLSVKNVARVVYEKSGASTRLEFAMWYWHHFPEELELIPSPATVPSHDDRLA